jgi:small-conductance mechanosensitive channel
MRVLATNSLAALIGIKEFWESWRGDLNRIGDYLEHPFKVGNAEFSVTSLIGGVIILILAVTLSRTLSRFLERQITKKAYLEPGLRYTLARLTQYVIIALGGLWALKFAFLIDLTSIAVLFTALSVGIGFGLRDIASDLAGGFILLFERPVRVGDRITIGSDEGDVQSINLRTTIILTNNRISIIVPNSKMVKERLINWSYGDPRARIAIPLQVDTTCDVQEVTRTMLKAAEGVDNVLDDPPPKVQFMDFGDWSNDFRLLVWTNRPRRHVQIRSDINYRIEKLFAAAGLKTAFPLTQVRIREGSLEFDSGGGKLLVRNKPSDNPDQGEKLDLGQESVGTESLESIDEDDATPADD